MEENDKIKPVFKIERGMYEIQRMRNAGWEFNTDTQVWESPEVVKERSEGKLDVRTLCT